MAINQHAAANLITTTVNAFNGDATSVSLIDGISLIDSWVSALGADDQTAKPISQGLSSLRAELRSGNPDGSHIQTIIGELADQASQVADSSEADVKTKLTSLVEALHGFNQQLSGSGSMADAYKERAPMTSTVGGESTTSGAGASTLTRSEATPYMDDPAGSDGGAEELSSDSDTDSEENIDMDDSTGSDGGAQTASTASADSSDFQTGSTGAASVGGMGVSGGTGDGDVSQSGGRSS